MDEKTDGDRGRLRLHRPTFRGSAVGWGISAVCSLSWVVMVVIGVARDDRGTTVLDVLFVFALVISFAVCLTGTVSTIRHPRPGPPPNAFDRG